jgi:hypothetical protein
MNGWLLAGGLMASVCAAGHAIVLRDREVMHSALPSLHAPLRVAGRGWGGGSIGLFLWQRVC